VGAASIREAVTVGGNVRLTSGKKTESISALWSVWGLKVFLINYLSEL
jgi:hypothetical protein